MKLLELGDTISRFRFSQCCVGLAGCLCVLYAVWTPFWLKERGLWTEWNDTESDQINHKDTFNGEQQATFTSLTCLCSRQFIRLRLSVFRVRLNVLLTYSVLKHGIYIKCRLWGRPAYEIHKHVFAGLCWKCSGSAIETTSESPEGINMRRRRRRRNIWEYSGMRDELLGICKQVQTRSRTREVHSLYQLKLSHLAEDKCALVLVFASYISFHC